MDPTLDDILFPQAGLRGSPTQPRTASTHTAPIPESSTQNWTGFIVLLLVVALICVSYKWYECANDRDDESPLFQKF